MHRINIAIVSASKFRLLMIIKCFTQGHLFIKPGSFETIVSSNRLGIDSHIFPKK